MGHNRAGSTGYKKTVNEAQPFKINDSLIFTHNWTLKTTYSLAKDYDLKESENKHTAAAEVIEVEKIEESKNVKIASTYDYYYVPTYYVDGVKLHEGVTTIDKIENVFKKAIE